MRTLLVLLLSVVTLSAQTKIRESVQTQGELSATQLPANVKAHGFGFTTDGATLVIGTGVKGYFTSNYAGTIIGWSITADGSSPTCTIDVWKIGAGTALPTVTNTIFGTKPALSTGNAKRGACPTDCSGWTTTFVAGDIFGFNVDAITVATKLTFELETTR